MRFIHVLAKQDRFRGDLARVSSSGGELPAPSARPSRMEQVLAGISQGDAALLVGGDLTVLVLEVPPLLPEPKPQRNCWLRLGQRHAAGQRLRRALG